MNSARFYILVDGNVSTVLGFLTLLHFAFKRSLKNLGGSKAHEGAPVGLLIICVLLILLHFSMCVCSVLIMNGIASLRDLFPTRTFKWKSSATLLGLHLNMAAPSHALLRNACSVDAHFAMLRYSVLSSC